MADIATQAAKEPTFDLPTGSTSDFYLSREINNREDSNHGKVVKKHGLWRYPFLTRRTGDSLVGTNEEITSSELRHGRTASKNKLGAASSSGAHDFEYSPETFDDQMEGAFRSSWVRWFKDGAANLITKDYKTAEGFIHVKGDDGSYNQVATGKNVTAVPLFYTDDEAGTAEDPFGLIKVSSDVYGYATRAAAIAAGKPLGKFVAHELHCGNTPVKYSFLSRIPITDDVVRMQDYKHVEVSEMSLNVTVNAIVTGSFQLMGSNNPNYFTEQLENGKTRMADKMAEDKDIAAASGENFYSADYTDAAEKFLVACKNTTKSTETDQFTALEGFLYVNGHQLQFCSDLTMDLNNNLQSIYAIFVKNAIANISPSLTITGNITAYFTDGEKDSNGVKFGADDLKNLASQNKDVEILYAFQDKEDPEVLYIFQIFKATFAAPDESKDADNPITLDLSYSSYGEMAVRCIRLAVPKIRDIYFDTEAALANLGTDVDITLYPNVPLDVTEDADYVDSASDSYVFKDVEVTVIGTDGTSTVDAGASFTGVAINEDGTISAKLTLSNALVEGDVVSIKLKVNGEDCEKSAEFVPTIDYLRMGKNYKNEVYATDSAVPLAVEGNLVILNAGTATPSTDEDYLLYTYNRAERTFTAADFNYTSSNEDVATVDAGVVTAVAAGTTTIKMIYKYDESITFSFDVKVSE